MPAALFVEVEKISPTDCTQSHTRKRVNGDAIVGCGDGPRALASCHVVLVHGIALCHATTRWPIPFTDIVCGMELYLADESIPDGSMTCLKWSVIQK